MFSGIIEDLGTLVSTVPRGNGRTLVIRTAMPVDDPSRLRGAAALGDGVRPGIRLGDSIAVNGTCLTVEEARPPDHFTVAVGIETLERTTIGQKRAGDRLHLERALRVGDRLDGHIVSGHVDGVAEIVELRRDHESVIVWLALPEDLSRYVAEKGSICLEGVSLTVNEVRHHTCRVNLIPFTADHTSLAGLRTGDRLNVEVDLLARYLERLMGDRVPKSGLTRERLVSLGFMDPKER